MKSALMAVIIMSATQNAFAIHCSVAGPSQPCTPGSASEPEKRAIIDLIKTAQKADARIKKLETNYRKVRDNPRSSPEDKLAACEPFYQAKKAQNDIYKDVLERTGKLYHVRPEQTSLIVGKPSDPALGYMKGLTPE